jgi:hypothetical protein
MSPKALRGAALLPASKLKPWRCGSTENVAEVDNMTTLIWNPNFQSLFLSPFIGAVMGLALALLFTPPAGQSVYVNIPRRQFLTILNNTAHHYHYGPSDNEKRAEVSGIFIISAMLYLIHGQTIITISTFLSAFIFFASLSFTVKFMTEEPSAGWLHLSCPIVTSAIAYVLCLDAQEIFNNFLITRPNAFDLTYSPTLLHKGAGPILFIVLALYSSTEVILREIALAGLTDPEDVFVGFRGWLIRHTERASGPRGWMRSLGAVVFAWFLMSGTLLQLFSIFTGR